MTATCVAPSDKKQEKLLPLFHPPTHTIKFHPSSVELSFLKILVPSFFRPGFLLFFFFFVLPLFGSWLWGNCFAAFYCHLCYLLWPPPSIATHFSASVSLAVICSDSVTSTSGHTRTYSHLRARSQLSWIMKKQREYISLGSSAVSRDRRRWICQRGDVEMWKYIVFHIEYSSYQANVTIPFLT